jgi:hypothetical protein
MFTLTVLSLLLFGTLEPLGQTSKFYCISLRLQVDILLPLSYSIGLNIDGLPPISRWLPLRRLPTSRVIVIFGLIVFFIIIVIFVIIFLIVIVHSLSMRSFSISLFYVFGLFFTL